MIEQVPVIDLFSGPGGLAEGFSPCKILKDSRRYKIVLSVEKEQYAYDTLLLRAFFGNLIVDYRLNTINF